MTFLYPLGLLGLLGIPVLIVIYIIKSKYTEQTVASTYLWTLSNRFLKRKNPISRVTGIISLILQILSIAVISLAIAHPTVTVAGAATEYCFLLDDSASMQMTLNGESRFDRAKDRVEALIEDAVDGSVYTLLRLSTGKAPVYERLESKAQAIELLNELSPAYLADDYGDALGTAQSYFDENPGVKTYLITDATFASLQNLTAINVSADEKNYAVGDVSYTLEDGKLTVYGNATAHAAGEPMRISLYIDGAATAAYSGSYMGTVGIKLPFQLYAEGVERFSSLRVVLENEDALAADNEFILFNKEAENSYSTLIVSDRPFFIESALRAISNASITVLSTEEFDNRRGYGLYIFDSFVPTELPADGATWFINPTGSVENAGFSYQGEVEPEDGCVLTLTDSAAAMALALREELLGNDIHLSKYAQCALTRRFTTLYSHEGDPVIFAGTNGNGSRQAVIAFDLHCSDLPLLFDYTVLMRNLLTYSFPDIIDGTAFTVGEELEVNVTANCESIRVDTPLGNVAYLETSGTTSSYQLTEAGTYTLTVTVAGSPKIFNVYASVEEREGQTSPFGGSLALSGEPTDGGLDGTYDGMTLLFILLAVLFLADWGIYCYEKHQLR